VRPKRTLCEQPVEAACREKEKLNVKQRKRNDRKSRSSKTTDKPELHVLESHGHEPGSEDRKREQARMKRLRTMRSKRELRLTPGFQTHEHLLKIIRKLPSDFAPYGNRTRTTQRNSDCSCGCRWFQPLAGSLGADWGICAGPESARRGLLTFEHMGCPRFEHDTRFDYLETEAGKRAMKRFQSAEGQLRAWQEKFHGWKSGKTVRGFDDQNFRE
jgi:hypothetical protein